MILQKFPTGICFNNAANFPYLVSKYSKVPQKDLICSNALKLHELEYVYDEQTLDSLIGSYIYNFQKLLNIKDENKLDAYQTKILIITVKNRCRGITFIELAMMFNRFLSGEFGHFYGQIDIMLMGEWIRQFMYKRGEIILDNQEIRSFILKRDQNI